MKSKILLWLSVITAGLTALLGGGRAGAVSNVKTPTGITVSPAFQQISIPAGVSAVPAHFTITNDRPVAQDLSLSVRDFNALNESGGLFFVGTNPTELQKKYGLAKWVRLPDSRLTIQPKQSATVDATVLNLPDLSAGGHYGALMISVNNQPSAGGKVALQSIASSLLFVTKPEGATHQLSLNGVDFSRSLVSLPERVSLRFQNTGNTHLIPRGSVYLQDSKGKLICKGIINENSNIILPQSYRRYDVSLKKISSAGRLGKYSLRVDFRFDGLNQYRSYAAGFWFFPGWAATTALVIALIIIILIITLVIRNLKARSGRRPPAE